MPRAVRKVLKIMAAHFPGIVGIAMPGERFTSAMTWGKPRAKRSVEKRRQAYSVS
jgi:hypothetical protein